MCEVWRWILISTGVPLVVVSFWDWPMWYIGTTRQRERMYDRTARLIPYRRFVYLAILVFVVATVVYLVHCTG
jgi:hypothetical protein